jgi:LCP family protein required for cell wall assembly
MNRKLKSSKYSSIDGFLKPDYERRPQIVRSVVKPSYQPPFPRYYSPYTSIPKAPSSKIKRRWSRKRKVVVSILTILFVGFGFGTYFGARIIGNVDKVFHGNLFSDVQAIFSTAKLKGEDSGRVNILLAGDSGDDPGHGGAQLTDSIMIISIDTQNHTGFMLSIPRDLWVYIPGWSHQKINASNDVTNFSQPGFPKGGMGQLEQIVQTDLGIPIDYYALIDYTAFKDAVNAVGGISVNIQSPDPRGLFDPNIAKVDGGPLLLKNGVQTLNGQTALNLARARGDPCYCGLVEYGFPQSDYNRTEHQRQMLTALAQKAQSLGVITNPIKVTSIFNAFGNNVATDLSLQGVTRFTQITKGMNVANLQSLVLSINGKNPLLKDYLAPDGEEALIPTAGIDNFGQIQQYIHQLTSNNPVVREAPSAVVLNASGITGLAHKEATVLQSKGFYVVGAADANNQYPGSMIVDLTKNQKPASKQLLQQLYSSNTTIASDTTSSNEAREAQGYNANFVIILGQNWNSSSQ